MKTKQWIIFFKTGSLQCLSIVMQICSSWIVHIKLLPKYFQKFVEKGSVKEQRGIKNHSINQRSLVLFLFLQLLPSLFFFLFISLISFQTDSNFFLFSLKTALAQSWNIFLYYNHPFRHPLGSLSKSWRIKTISFYIFHLFSSSLKCKLRTYSSSKLVLIYCIDQRKELGDNQNFRPTFLVDF